MLPWGLPFTTGARLPEVWSMLESALKVNEFVLGYGRMLMADVDDARIAERPVAGVNHPAWILGHLIFSTDILRDLLGHPKVLPETWTAQFGVGSKPSTNRADYLSKEELLGLLDRNFAEVRQLAASATEEQLGQPNPHPRSRDALPTTRELVVLLLTGHAGVHLGQLSTWRRMIGMAPLF